MVNEHETDKIVTDINADQAKAETVWQEIEAWWDKHFHSKDIVVPVAAKTALRDIIISKTQTRSQTMPVYEYNGITASALPISVGLQQASKTPLDSILEEATGPKPVGADTGIGGANS